MAPRDINQIIDFRSEPEEAGVKLAKAVANGELTAQEAENLMQSIKLFKERLSKAGRQTRPPETFSPVTASTQPTPVPGSDRSVTSQQFDTRNITSQYSLATPQFIAEKIKRLKDLRKKLQYQLSAFGKTNLKTKMFQRLIKDFCDRNKVICCNASEVDSPPEIVDVSPDTFIFCQLTERGMPLDFAFQITNNGELLIAKKTISKDEPIEEVWISITISDISQV